MAAMAAAVSCGKNRWSFPTEGSGTTAPISARSVQLRSMSGKGCSPDNAACEGFFGRLKNEMFYGRDWRGVSQKEFIRIVDSYIHWYNEKRIKLSLGGLSPVQYRIAQGLC